MNGKLAMESERVREPFSIRMTTEQGDYLLDPRFDYVRLCRWLGYGIVNVVVETGIHRLYITEEQSRAIQERGIPLVELEWLVTDENENMRKVIGDNLESWFNDETR